ncbi:N-acetyl-glucosamine-6-phosphate deacetylase [Haplosporangium sp. Z 11]|nr:N-acetyl-glucosamine-6-phosphate deacetylase [Haplosporangium sp. Z 11]
MIRVLSKDFKLKIPQDSHPGLIATAIRYRDRIFASVFRSPPEVDQSQVKKISLDSVEVNVEDSGTETLGLEIDGSYRLSMALNEELDVPFGINEERCTKILQGYPLQDKIKGTITAKTMYGSLYGLGTFAQLMTSSPHDNSLKNVCNPTLIHDRPLIPHRGVMLDNSRNYLSMASLYKTIDTMTLNKFGVFHRHNANSQPFPSAMDDEPYMISDTISGLKKMTAFPAIKVCLDGYHSFSRLSVESPNGQQNRVMPKDIHDVSDQALPLLKKEHVHAGAGTAKIKYWDDNAPLWEVPLLNHNLTTLEDNKDTVIQNWTISQNIKKAIQRGYKMISGSVDYGCLDRDWLDNWSLSRPWCDPHKSSQRIYSFNPLMGLDYEETKKILDEYALF